MAQALKNKQTESIFTELEYLISTTTILTTMLTQIKRLNVSPKVSPEPNTASKY